MKNKSSRQSTIAILAGALLLMFGLLLSISAQPAEASPLLQTGYPGDTATVTATLGGATNTPTVTATLGGATATATVTATRGTLAPPRTGTPTQLVPVTGADLTEPPSQAALGFWIALWLVGLLLIGFGLRAKLSKR